MTLMEIAGPQPAGLDMTAASIGASVGFVAAYAACKLLRRGNKKDDGFARVWRRSISVSN